MRTRLAIPVLAFALAVFPALARADAEDIDVSIFAAHSNDRINAPTGSSESEHSAQGLALGIKLEMAPIITPRLCKWPVNFQWRVYGIALLSKRAYQADSTGDVPKRDDLARRITDADAGEFYAGMRFMVPFGSRAQPNASHWAPRRFAAYARLEVGGISASDSIGDLIDTNFFGGGIEYQHYPFSGSFIEFGLGQTDLFLPSRRTHREKLRLGIEYALTDRDSIRSGALYPVSSVFVHVRVDSDGKNDAADGVRVIAGLRLDAVETLKSAGKLLGIEK